MPSKWCARTPNADPKRLANALMYNAMKTITDVRFPRPLQCSPSSLPAARHARVLLPKLPHRSGFNKFVCPELTPTSTSLTFNRPARIFYYYYYFFYLKKIHVLTSEVPALCSRTRILDQRTTTHAVHGMSLRRAPSVTSRLHISESHTRSGKKVAARCSVPANIFGFLEQFSGHCIMQQSPSPHDFRTTFVVQSLANFKPTAGS